MGIGSRMKILLRQVSKMNEERGLTVNELINKLLEIPNQEQRVVMHIYKDGIFLNDEVRDVCQANQRRGVIVLINQ